MLNSVWDLREANNQAQQPQTVGDSRKHCWLRAPIAVLLVMQSQVLDLHNASNSPKT